MVIIRVIVMKCINILNILEDFGKLFWICVWLFEFVVLNICINKWLVKLFEIFYLF